MAVRLGAAASQRASREVSQARRRPLPKNVAIKLNPGTSNARRLADVHLCAGAQHFARTRSETIELSKANVSALLFWPTILNRLMDLNDLPTGFWSVLWMMLYTFAVWPLAADRRLGIVFISGARRRSARSPTRSL